MRCRKVPGLSERLKEALLKCPYSPTQIEKKTGVNHSFISQYTAETMTPSIYTLSVLAKLCGVTTDYLIYGEEAKNAIHNSER